MSGGNRFALARVGFDTDGRESLFREVVRHLHAAGSIPEQEAPFDCLMAREEVSSTAMGRGIALPHARCSACDELIVCAVRLERAMEFDAPDGDPVDLVFLILGPEEPPGEHVALLGKIARLVSRPGTLEALRRAPDEPSFRTLLEEGMAAGEI